MHEPEDAEPDDDVFRAVVSGVRAPRRHIGRWALTAEHLIGLIIGVVSILTLTGLAIWLLAR